MTTQKPFNQWTLIFCEIWPSALDETYYMISSIEQFLHLTARIITRALAMEFLAYGIRANTISSGIVDTPMHANDDDHI